MSLRLTTAPQRRTPPTIVILAVVDFILLLFPPIHWFFGNGDPVVSIGYFLGSGLFVCLSLVVMYRIDKAVDDEPPASDHEAPIRSSHTVTPGEL